MRSRNKHRYLSRKDIVFAGVLTACMIVFLSGCNQGNQSSAAGDVVTQQAVSAGRKPVTVLVKYAFSINTFEKAVEEKFPEIDLIQVGNYTGDMGIAEYESRLEHDDLTDIVMTWPLEIGKDYWEDRLMDLSGFYFTANYNLSMLNSISRDGKLYYLPGPSQVRGIVYNKTLFAENNWAVPKDFNEFTELCKTIEATGMRSLQLGLGDGEVLETAFVGYSYNECFSEPKDARWLSDYNLGKGNFFDQFAPAFKNFQTLIDNGILQEKDLDITYADREKMLFTRKCAMVEDSVLLARMGHSYTGTTDEYALMPFFNPNDGGDWARLYMVCYIGLNKHLEEAQNKETYDLVMKLMEYISTPEGQEALMGDTGAMFSSLSGVEASTVPEIEALTPALENGRYAIFPQFENAQQALREGLAEMIRGNVTAQDVCSMVDAQNNNPPKVEEPLLLGTASADFTLKETGNFVTDCMREAAGSEIALFLDNGKDGKYNGKGISASLYQGDVTTTDIARILPDLKQNETGTMWVIAMTGEDLIKTLEYSIPVNNNVSGWFYYFSGLRMAYDVTAEPGSRIHKITMQDGKQIVADQVYTIAVMDHSVPEEFMISCEETDQAIADILYKAIEEKKTIKPSGDGRFVSGAF